MLTACLLWRLPPRLSALSVRRGKATTARLAAKCQLLGPLPITWAASPAFDLFIFTPEKYSTDILGVTMGNQNSKEMIK